jgi:RNA polymerase sigma factor (sigma-70 family)
MAIRSVGTLIAEEIATKLASYGYPLAAAVPDEVPVTLPQGIKVPLKALGLSTRVYNALTRARIRTIGQLATLSRDDLLGILNIGSTAIAEIEARLAAYREQAPNSDTLADSATPPPGANDPLLHAVSVARLGLPHELNAQLGAAGLQMIGQVVAGLSRHSYRPEVRQALAAYLVWWAEQSPAARAAEVTATGPSHMAAWRATLDGVVTCWLARLDDRPRQIIRLRYGLDGPALTLEEVGQRLGITRERVRQLENRTRHRLQFSDTDFLLVPIDAFATLFEQTLVENGGMMTVAECVAWLEAEGDMALGPIRPSGVVELLCAVDKRFAWLTKVRLVMLSSLLDTPWTQVQAALAKLLRGPLTVASSQSVYEAFQGTELWRQLLDSDLATTSGIPIDRFVMACLRTHPRLDQPGEETYAVRRGRNSIVNELIAAMREMGEPAHFTLITERVNALLPAHRQTKYHSVHALLGRYEDVFARVGHGIFGLVEWGLHNDGNLANAVERVLTTANKPLHVDTITREVLKTWRVNAGSVYAAIQNDARFVSLGAAVYYLRDRVVTGAATEGLEFAELFGDQLASWQEQLPNGDGKAVPRAPHDEVNVLRGIGLNLFAD